MFPSMARRLPVRLDPRSDRLASAKPMWKDTRPPAYEPSEAPIPQPPKIMSEDPSELAERGNEIFERVVRPEVDAESDAQKFVVIDVETEDYEIDANARAAFDRLVERRPDARGRTWLRRVGSRHAYHFGGRLREPSTE